MLIIIILCIAVGIFCLFAVVGGAYMYRFATVRDHSGKRQVNLWENEMHPSEHFSPEIRAEMKAGAEYIKTHISAVHRIKSHDGLTLTAHSVEPKAPTAVVIMSHGYRSHAVNDFSCAVEFMNKCGFACFLIDQRAHGYSEGEKIGFGALEKQDIVRWCAYVSEHYDLPIILDGVSMGSSILMMGGEVGYPDAVKALICDCGYSSQADICKLTMKKWFSLPPFPIYYMAKLFIRLFAGYDLDKTTTEKGLLEIRKRGIPILIAHGDADDFVPYAMSKQNYAVLEGAKTEKGEPLAELFTAAGASHGLSFLVDKNGYIDALYRLFDKAGIEYHR